MTASMFPRDTQQLAKLVRNSSSQLVSRPMGGGITTVEGSKAVSQMCEFTADRRSSRLHHSDLVRVTPQKLRSVIGSRGDRWWITAAVILMSRGIDDLVTDHEALAAIARVVVHAHHKRSQEKLFAAMMTMNRSGLIASAAMLRRADEIGVTASVASVLYPAAADGDLALSMITGAEPGCAASAIHSRSDMVDDVLIHLTSHNPAKWNTDLDGLRLWMEMVTNGVPLDWATDSVTSKTL